MSWIEVRAQFDPSVVDLSPFVEIFRDHGIENTLEDGAGLIGCVVAVEGSDSAVRELTAALQEAGAIDVQARDLPEENWDELWRRHFKPRRVGRRFVVRPTWEEFDLSPEDVEIVLDPGQAFGTGEHATTRMCLELIEDVDVAGKTVLDLGCGSGILSVALVKLGATVTAIDIDPLSIEVTRENAAVNGVAFEAIVGDGAPLTGRYDVVVSNIISATLIRLAPDVAGLLPSGGDWIISGVIVQNWADVRAAAERAEFALKDHREDEGWVAAHFVRA
jgi:ribosomal protein L11 methyltransferase